MKSIIIIRLSIIFKIWFVIYIIYSLAPMQEQLNKDNSKNNSSNRRKVSPMDFKTFLNNFIEENGLYKPKDQSANYYRHFGQRKSNNLYLEYREILYLFDKTAKALDPELKAYFELKNNDYNILVSDRNQFIYNKTKFFNRKKAVPIAKLAFVNKDEDILRYFTNLDKKVIFSIAGQEDFCLIECDFLPQLDKEISDKMIKTPQ